jgi:organic radical activating enzyme
VADILDQVLATSGIEGVTVTGGEPLDQPQELAAFLRESGPAPGSAAWC